MKLCTYLFDQLYQHGAREIFGIPGDFVLNLYEALSQDQRFKLITFSHEPAVGFAADASARITNGIGVCCITYGAGGLNMVNSVACAYAEKSPLIVISGGPGKIEKSAGLLVHHEVKSFESQLKVYNEVVEYGTILDDPNNAAREIRKAIDTALTFRRPVYIEVPRDMVFAEITVPTLSTEVALLTDQDAVKEAAQEIAGRLTKSKSPVLIVGVEVHRFKLQQLVRQFAERLQIPVTSSFLGRGVFPTNHPQFIGTYLGTVSPQPMRDIVESSDCLLLLGEVLSDTGLGISSHVISPKNTVICASRDVFISHHRYQSVPLADLLSALLNTPELKPRTGLLPQWRTDVSPEIDQPYNDSDRIQIRHVINELNKFLSEVGQFPIVADTGDSLFAAIDIRADICVGPAYYATMGFAIPAAIGIQVSSRIRPIVLVGDGAFQMTGPEIAHCKRLGLNPIIVLLNNQRWEMLQAFFPNATYNETVAWPFADLAPLWGGRGMVVTNPAEFRAALQQAVNEKCFTLINVELERGDISPILRGFVSGFKKRF
jgi:indolepyruvate decarboxylase